jgi:hypothetical protein
MGHFKMDCMEICCDGIRVAEYHMHASVVSSFSGAELSDSAATEFMFSVFEGARVVN